MRTIQFYTTEDGYCPVSEFLDSLQSKQAQKVAWVLQLVEETDIVPVTYFKKMVNTDELWEVRAQVGSNIFRLLGFYDDDNLVILNHGFQKKTQKTPLAEIERAKRIMNEYFSEKNQSPFSLIEKEPEGVSSPLTPVEQEKVFIKFQLSALPL